MKNSKAEAILKGAVTQDAKEYSASQQIKEGYTYLRQDLAITAMQTYAEQKSLEFAEWIKDNGFLRHPDCYTDERDSVLTPTQLYSIYKTFDRPTQDIQ